MRPYIDEESTVEPALNEWSINYVEGTVRAHTAKSSSNLVGWMHGAGNAYNLDNSVKHCTFDN